jgi:uncharacterized protein with PIN domain
MKDTNCPYCNTEIDINHDDGYGYDENKTHQQYCGKCDKNFIYGTSISFYYEVSKADCLNDGNHDFKPTKTFPEFMKEMECTMCRTTRKPTNEERITYSIPTYEEYLKEQKILNNE